MCYILQFSLAAVFLTDVCGVKDLLDFPILRRPVLLLFDAVPGYEQLALYPFQASADVAPFGGSFQTQQINVHNFADAIEHGAHMNPPEGYEVLIGIGPIHGRVDRALTGPVTQHWRMRKILIVTGDGSGYEPSEHAQVRAVLYCSELQRRNLAAHRPLVHWCGAGAGKPTWGVRPGGRQPSAFEFDELVIGLFDMEVGYDRWLPSQPVAGWGHRKLVVIMYYAGDQSKAAPVAGLLQAHSVPHRLVQRAEELQRLLASAHTVVFPHSRAVSHRVELFLLHARAGGAEVKVLPGADPHLAELAATPLRGAGHSSTQLLGVTEQAWREGASPDTLEELQRLDGLDGAHAGHWSAHECYDSRFVPPMPAAPEDGTKLPYCSFEKVSCCENGRLMLHLPPHADQTVERVSCAHMADFEPYGIGITSTSLPFNPTSCAAHVRKAFVWGNHDTDVLFGRFQHDSLVPLFDTMMEHSMRTGLSGIDRDSLLIRWQGWQDDKGGKRMAHFNAPMMEALSAKPFNLVLDDLKHRTGKICFDHLTLGMNNRARADQLPPVAGDPREAVWQPYVRHMLAYFGYSVGPSTIPANRCLFVKRRVGERLIRNEPEVEQTLREQGMDLTALAFERTPFADAVKLMQGTRVLMAMEGSGLANAYFLPLHSVVVVLMPWVEEQHLAHYRVENLVVLNTLMLAGHHVLWWRNTNQTLAEPNTELWQPGDYEYAQLWPM